MRGREREREREREGERVTSSLQQCQNNEAVFREAELKTKDGEG